MAIGRPIELTPNITSKNISVACTEGQTEFTVTGGYRINELGVYRNGVRLVDGRDFSATDGQTVTFISDTVIADDIVEFSVLDSFDIAGTIVSAASTQTLNGNLHVTESLFVGTFNPNNIVATAATINSLLHVGSALTANAAGDVETIGIITASTFSGNITGNITGAASQITVADESSDTTCFPTFVTAATGDLAPKSGTNLTFNSSSGALTATSVNGNIVGGTVSGTTGTFSGAVNVDDTTDSTSSTSGALIVDGGLGVAKNVYIGAGLSVAGTLTYEDVTNVDSVGMVTAKSGVNVSGGELNVGLGFSVGNVGVVTAQNVTISAGTIDLKNSGSVSNVKFYCEVANAHYTALQSAAHSAYGGNVTITLPTTTDTLVGRTTTDTLTNKTLTSPTINTLSGDTASFSSNLTVGSGITMGSAGVITATSYYGDGSNLSNITSTTINSNADNRLITGSGTANTLNGETALTFDGEFKVGTALTVASTSGVATFGQDVTFLGADGYHMSWDQSTNQLRFPDYAKVAFGDPSGNGDTRMYQNGTTFYLYAETGTENILIGGNGPVSLRYDGTTRLATTDDGTVTTGIGTFSNGLDTVGMLRESFNTVAGKLSDNTNIDLNQGMVHYFTTQETTTSTPNIRFSSSKSLNNMMKDGDAISVTIITTAAAAGYSAQLTIDGSAVTEQWVGGAAPSAGGSDGYDILTYNILKTSNATFFVIGNLVNAT